LTGANIGVFGRAIAISPDGRWIVATVAQSGRAALVIRQASSTEWRPLTDGETASNATFSPGSDWVAFQTGDARIMKVPVRGGPPLPLGTGARPHWSASDSVLFTPYGGGEILSVGPDGGEPTVVYQSDSVPAVGPHLLPGGRGVLFQTATNPESSRILLFDREAGEVRQVAPSGTDPRYVEAGYILFGHPDGGLLAAPFDLRRLEVTGETVPVLPSVQVGSVTQYGVSRNGTLVYLVGGAAATSVRFVEVTMEGAERPLGHDAGAFYIPRYSPDGSTIAYEAEDEGDTELRLYDVASGADRQFTSGGGSIAVWAEDGEDLYYTNSSVGVGYRRPWDSREAATRLFSSELPVWFSDVTHDGLAIVSRIAGGGDLFLARLDADSISLQDFLVTDAWEGHADISPDGRWVTYVSDQDGELRVYANTFPDLSSPRAISPGFAVDPVWSPDGRTIYYRAGERFYAVDVRTEPTLVVTGAPRELFERAGYVERVGTNFRNWDLHPDGDRFLMLTPAAPEENDAPRALIVTSWFEELRELVGS
jgi:Tol biopolymer transport system component